MVSMVSDHVDAICGFKCGTEKGLTSTSSFLHSHVHTEIKYWSLDSYNSDLREFYMISALIIDVLHLKDS